MNTLKKNSQKKGVKQKPLAEIKPNKNNSTASIVFILLITTIVFSNSLINNFIINWDDDGYIINNPLIKEFSLNGIKTIFTIPHLDNYHPLTTLSNAIELKLFGLNPKPYHVFNLILHLLNTLLVFRFVKLLSGRMEVAAITALFFGIHPMHVESVSWISERKDVLYSFFFLSSLIFYLHYIKNNKSIYFTVSLLLFIFSLLSKPAAVALSPTLLIIDYYVGRKISLKTVLEKIPFFALSLFFGILAMRIQQSSGSTNLAPLFSGIDKIFLVSYALVFYILKLIAPFGLSAIHLYPINDALSWEYYFAPVIISLIIWVIYKAREYRKDLLFGMLFFFITIALVIQIIPVGRSIVAERYTYIPYIGLFYIIGKFYCLVMDNKIAIAQKIKPYILPVLIGYTCILLIITWNRNKAWKDSNVLFSKAIETNPDDYFAYFARATGEVLLGDAPAAIADFNQVIRLNPTYTDAFYSRGVMKEKINTAEAISDYTEAIRLTPTYDKAFYNRGNLKINAKDYNGAISDYDAAIKINSKNAQAYCNRGVAKFNLGQIKEAILDYNEAILLNPKLSNAYYNRGNSEFNIGNSSKACDDWHKAMLFGFTDAQKMIEQYCN